MNFLTCIDTAVETGKIKPEKGDEAKRAYENAYTEAVGEGLSGRAADDRAALKAVEQLAKMTQAKKWQKVNEIRVAAKLWDRFALGDRPDLEMQKLADEWEIAKDRVAGQATTLFINNLEAWRPRAAGIYSPVKDMDNIIRAAYGETKDPVAKKLYEEFVNTDEFLRKRANMEGASIHENPNRRMAQQQDRNKLVRQQKALGTTAAKAEWMQEHLDGLDWEMMRYDGIEIPVNRREEILSRSYDSILTRGNSRLVPGHAGGETLANRLGRERFFYYRDADTWLKMQEKYGAGNVFLQGVSGIEIMARDIAMLEHMGPNPTGMLNYIDNVARKRAADLDIEKGGKGKPMVDRVDKSISTLRARFELHNHLVNNGDASLMAQTLGTTRTVVMAGILSKAFIANLGDLGFGKNAMMAHRIPATRYIRSVVKTFMQMPVKARRKAAMEAGLNMESATSMALAAQRYLGPLDGAYFGKKLADIQYRATFLTPWTQAGQWAAGRHIMSEAFAGNVKTKFDKLPFVDDLRRHGITEADWDEFRKTPLVDDNGVELLRPIDVQARTDLDETVRQRLSDKFFDFMLEMQREAVPGADTLVQTVLGHSVPANTIRGQETRAIGMLKSFATVIMLRHMKDALQRPTVGGRIGHVARLVTVVTLAGAFITQMKELAAGRDPLDMTTGGFWVRAMLNGGSLGFAGDALFSGLNRFRHGGLTEAFGGPLLGFLGEFRDLTIGNMEEIIAGKETKFSKELTEFGFRYAPIPWQIKLALERAIIEDLLQWGDPKTLGRLKRREQQRFTDYGQKSWWRPGERLPGRAPNLGAIFGGSGTSGTRF